RTVAIDAGLSAADVDRVLTGSDYTEEVRADEAQAHQLGISGVPFFLFEEKWAISGAQPVEAFVQGLHTIWEATHPQPQASAFVDLGGQDNNAPSCGPEGC
ncbi:DsbA family oxidoreductase, partial [Bacteroides thetaiotaomicron]|uniref:DsbA family oxidoreductase n=1 Tax=Bacteroides thetaiotaomicron TaxID=818 RepID=UPI0019262BE7